MKSINLFTQLLVITNIQHLEKLSWLCDEELVGSGNTVSGPAQTLKLIGLRYIPGRYTVASGVRFGTLLTTLQLVF